MWPHKILHQTLIKDNSFLSLGAAGLCLEGTPDPKCRFLQGCVVLHGSGNPDPHQEELGHVGSSSSQLGCPGQLRTQRSAVRQSSQDNPGITTPWNGWGRAGSLQPVLDTQGQTRGTETVLQHRCRNSNIRRQTCEDGATQRPLSCSDTPVAAFPLCSEQPAKFYQQGWI